MEKPNKTSRGASSSATSSAEARRIRKRELDRHAQRCARQRTKDRIAFLEQRLEESYRAEPGQRRVAALLDELSSVKQQRDELMAIVSSIQKTLQNGLPAARQNNSTSPPALPSTTATTTALLPVPAVSLDNSLDNTLGDSLDVTLDDTGLLLSDPQQPDVAATMASSAGLAASLAGGTACPSYDITTVDADNGSNADLGTLAAGDDVEPIMPLPEAPCHCITVDNQHKASSNIWRSVNCTLMKRQSTSPPSRPRPSRVSTTDALFDEDVPVRAVLQGWQAVEEAGLLTAAWKKLKAVDELCFASCDNVVRLAVLTMMHIFLRWDTDPSPQNLQAMPQWYLQRPSQKMAHSGAIDYFVW
ncbi:hypothetical protein SBRCBS47491_007917 [Sporothrix bragantina]|uniref:BZIP domain-containing protein n=1 Tax=Sporothrix bragantina TaxID=671064 RepID=A0ABP0CHG7_9PEZI